MAYISPQTATMFLNGRSGQTVPVTTVSRSSYVVLPGDEFTFSHPFLTDTAVPAFTPSWNTNVWPVTITDRTITAKFSVPAGMGATIDTVVSPGTKAYLSTGATSYTITHNLNNANAVVLVAASFNTAIYRRAKDANSLTVGFSTEAPYGAIIYWAEHSEPTDIAGTDTITADAVSYPIPHNAGRTFLPVFTLPTWATTVWFGAKGDIETTVKFSVSPPLGGFLDRRVKVP